MTDKLVTQTAILLDTIDIHRLLSERAKAEGGQAAWAAKLGISRSYMNDIMFGRRPPSEAVLLAIGYRKVDRYVPVRKAP